MRLIDADVLLKELRRNYEKGEIDKYTNIELGDFVEYAESVFQNIPSVDVEPVRHGRWTEDSHGALICSACGSEVNDEIVYMLYPHGTPDYCPYCGAKMDYDEWLASKDR